MTAPLITAVSKPNKKPPKAATPAIKMTKVVLGFDGTIFSGWGVMDLGQIHLAVLNLKN